MCIHYFPKYIINIYQYGPNHHFKWKIQHFLTKARAKDTIQNTQKHAISTEKKFFFSGEGLDLSQTPPLMARIPLPHPTPVLAKTSEFAHLFPQNSKQFYTTAIKSMF